MHPFKKLQPGPRCEMFFTMVIFHEYLNNQNSSIHESLTIIIILSIWYSLIFDVFNIYLLYMYIIIYNLDYSEF